MLEGTLPTSRLALPAGQLLVDYTQPSGNRRFGLGRGVEQLQCIVGFASLSGKVVHTLLRVANLQQQPLLLCKIVGMALCLTIPVVDLGNFGDLKFIQPQGGLAQVLIADEETAAASHDENKTEIGVNGVESEGAGDSQSKSSHSQHNGADEQQQGGQFAFFRQSFPVSQCLVPCPKGLVVFLLPVGGPVADLLGGPVCDLRIGGRQAVISPFGLFQLFQSLSVPAVQLVGLHAVPNLQGGLQIGLFGGQLSDLPRSLCHPRAGGVHVPEGLVQTEQLLLQFGDEAVGPVGPTAVAPVLQCAFGGGIGYVLLPGGGQCGDAGLQLAVLGDGGAVLSHEGGAEIDLFGDTGELFAHIGGGQAGDGVSRGGVNRLKAAKGVAFGSEAADGNVLALPLYPEFPRQGSARPGLVAVFVRQEASFVPLLGVDAVEHGFQEARPGGFSRLVGGGDDGEPIAGGEDGLLQSAEGGGHFNDFHGQMSSPPSKAANPNRVASSS